MQDEREREKLTGRPSKVAAAASALHHPLRVWRLALSMWRAHDDTTMRSDASPRDITQSKAAMAKAMRLGFGGQTVSLARSCSSVGSRSRTRHLLSANCLRRSVIFHPHPSVHERPDPPTKRVVYNIQSNLDNVTPSVSPKSVI